MSRFLSAVLASLSLCGADNPPTLAIGSAAPAFSLPGIDGKTHSLPDNASSKVLSMYRRREFDMITVSTNLPDEKQGVMRVLNKYHASTRNLHSDSTGAYAMQAAFESKWEAGVPFTVLLSPDGKVVYQKQGEIDILELRKAILASLPDSGCVAHRAYWASLQP